MSDFSVPGSEKDKPGGYLPPHTQGQLPPPVPPPPEGHLSPPRDTSNPARNFLLAIVLILLAGAAFLFFVGRGGGDGAAQQDVIALSLEHMERIDLEFETQNPDQASRYVRDKFGRRVSAPNVHDAYLLGVGSAEIAPEARIPAFIYRDSEGLPFVVYAYNYAILDQQASRLRIERSILRNIEDDSHREVRDLGRERVMIWRDRDDIFVVITEDSPEAVRRRIFTP